jgi:hypothetical protein
MFHTDENHKAKDCKHVTSERGLETPCQPFEIGKRDGEKYIAIAADHE